MRLFLNWGFPGPPIEGTPRAFLNGSHTAKNYFQKFMFSVHNVYMKSLPTALLLALLVTPSVASAEWVFVVDTLEGKGRLYLDDDLVVNGDRS